LIFIYAQRFSDEGITLPGLGFVIKLAS